MDYVNLKKNFRNSALIIKALDSHLSLLICKVEWFVIGYMGINKRVKFFPKSENQPRNNLGIMEQKYWHSMNRLSPLMHISENWYL